MKLLTQLLTLILITTQFALASPPERGLASYYDDSFHGRKTASGEKYDKNKLTAAHKTLPFGTKVKIVNPANKKSVEVIINDRGPYIKGRIIELSKKAALEIDMVKVAVTEVEITVVGTVPVSTDPEPEPVVAENTKEESKTTTTTTTTTTTKTDPQKVEDKKTDDKKADDKKITSTKTSTTKTEPTKTSSSKSKTKEEPKTNLIVEAQQMEVGGLYKMQVLKLESKGFGVQVAGYSDYQAVVQQLAVFQKNWFKGANIFVDDLNGKPYYKIILGPMATKEEAASYCESLKAKYNMKDAFVVNIEELAKK